MSIVTPFAGSTAHLCDDYFAAVRCFDEVVIVDNASDEATAAALRAASARYIRNPTNRGFSAANNQGFAASTGDIVVFMNSDVALADKMVGTPEMFYAQVKRDVRENLLVGPVISNQLVYGLAVPYVDGWCVAATRETWAKMFVERDAPWDAAAYPGPYWEDCDLSLRAMYTGIDLESAEWSITHKGGQTIGPLLRCGDSYEKNRATFAARVRPHWERVVRQVQA